MRVLISVERWDIEDSVSDATDNTIYSDTHPDTLFDQLVVRKLSLQER